MSLSAVTTALAEYVADVLVNECDRPIPGRILRYWGIEGVPQDWACDDNGVLSVAVDRGFASKEFPIDSATRPEPCAGMPAYVVAIRYDICWKVVKASKTGLELYDEQHDADSAMLMDIADSIMRALLRLQCKGIENDNLKAKAVVETLRQTNDLALRFREVVPSKTGSSARLTWRVYCGPSNEAPS